jgi:hypothetical protein
MNASLSALVTALLVILVVMVAIYGTLTMYWAIMALARAKESGHLSPWALRIAYPLLAVGYLCDFLLNVFVVSWILLEVPRELLVTARLSRHIKAESGWRKSVSTWVCQHLLDWADPKGCHCR